LLGLLAVSIGALALVAAGCGGDDEAGGGGPVTALPASSCSPIEYKGEGEPEAIIATDFPMQGGSRTQTLQIVDATRFLLEEQDWKAGDLNIGLQVCDDATAQAAKWDPDKCSRNAHAYAQNESVIAVHGTFNSGCAAIEIPVLNQAPEFAQKKGVKSVYILNDKEAYGLGVAKNFQGAAEALGIKVLGFGAFDPKQPNFRAIFTKVKATNPDAIFIGGLVDENSGQLINDKVAVLGPNTDTPANGTMLLLPDGYTTDALFQRSEGGTPNAKGAFLSVAGVGVDKYKGPALEFIDKFKPRLQGRSVDPYAILGAQAARILLDAIERSDGTRAGVIEEIFKTKVDDGLIGSFEINENGDLTGAKGAALLFTIYKGTTKLETLQTTSPKANLVDAARKAAAG
jgi:branched-chain amino acid transport system substrate-binding protein